MSLEVRDARATAQADAAYNTAALRALGVPVGDNGSERRATVAIGFVDYGFDLLHPTLRDHAGGSRFRWLWDQNATPNLARQPGIDPKCLGDWNEKRIAHQVGRAVASGSRRALDALYDPNAHDCGRSAPLACAHGTLMASIAAGTAVAGFTGAAPDALLLGVQLALQDHDWKEQDASGRPTWLGLEDRAIAAWSGWRSYDESPQIINAIRYLYDRGCRLGVDVLVINLSIGAWAGGHDGHSPVEQAVASICEEADASWRSGRGPRVVVVAGAGNAGVDEGHWHAIIGASEERTFDWITQRADRTQNKLEIWCSGHDAMQCEVRWPGKDWIPIPQGKTCRLVCGETPIGIAEHLPHARRDLGRVRLLVHPPLLPAGLFDGADTCAVSIRVRSVGSEAVEVNAWIERDDGIAERSWLSPCATAGTLCCLATAPGALVVAGYDHDATMAGWPPVPLPLSSAGPSPWRRQSSSRVPHFCAPARDIWGARSKTRGFARTTGTSAAVALVSGALARLFAMRGVEADLPPCSGDWSPRLGHGVFRILPSAYQE